MNPAKIIRINYYCEKKIIISHISYNIFNVSLREIFYIIYISIFRADIHKKYISEQYISEKYISEKKKIQIFLLFLLYVILGFVFHKEKLSYIQA